jgi:8-oxo-dGTP diphosphatase
MSESLQRVALGIVRYDDHVLLIERRKKEQGSNGEFLNWAFPGGEIEPGETPFGTAEREVYEETGRHVIAQNTLDEMRHPSFPAHIYYIACQLSERSAEKVNDHGVIQAKWIPIAKLDMFITSSLNKNVQKHLLL